MKYCPRLRLGTIYIMCPLTNKSLYCTVDWEIKPQYPVMMMTHGDGAEGGCCLYPTAAAAVVVHDDAVKL